MALAGVVIVLGRSGLMTDDLRRIIELIVVLLVDWRLSRLPSCARRKNNVYSQIKYRLSTWGGIFVINSTVYLLFDEIYVINRSTMNAGVSHGVND